MRGGLGTIFGAARFFRQRLCTGVVETREFFQPGFQLTPQLAALRIVSTLPVLAAYAVAGDELPFCRHHFAGEIALLQNFHCAHMHARCLPALRVAFHIGKESLGTVAVALTLGVPVAEGTIQKVLVAAACVDTCLATGVERFNHLGAAEIIKPQGKHPQGVVGQAAFAFLQLIERTLFGFLLRQ